MLKFQPPLLTRRGGWNKILKKEAGILKRKSSAGIYLSIAGVVVLLVINAFAAAHFTDPFSGGAGIDMDNLAGYDVSRTDTDDRVSSANYPSESGEDVSSGGKLLYPTDYPYFIEIDKTNQVITVFTTSSSGKYDKPVRVMLCSTPEKSKRFTEGYWKLTGDRTTQKNPWRALKRYGQTVYAQYVTKANGFLYFQSVPYSEASKDKLDQLVYGNLGSPDPEGSILLTVENARWINENCNYGTWIHVTEKKRDKSLTQALKEQLPKPDVTGWDPTDPDPANPNYHPQYTEEAPEPEGYAVDNRGLDELEKSH